jgi:long-chain acyl-CoA synthetase
MMLEAKLRHPIPDEMVAQMRTVGDVIDAIKLLQSRHSIPDLDLEAEREEAKIEPPERTSSTGKLGRLLRFGLRLLYRRYFSLECYGAENIPRGQPYIIAANHASHLDTGAIVTALGHESRRLKVLAARDYFFNTFLKAWFFGKLLKFVPFERKGNLLQFLRDVKTSNEMLLENRCLLIYPEGTRSVTGELQPFKAGVGLLAYETGAPIVPAYIDGAYQAMPKGRHLPRKHRIKVFFGEPIAPDLSSTTPADAMNHEIQRKIVDEIKTRIEALKQGVGSRE